MKGTHHNIAILFVLALTMFTCQLIATSAQAQSSFFTSRGCSSCHSAPVAATCNGCHHHGNASLRAATDKTSYAPGEAVTATLSGGNRSGWISAILYDQNNAQLAASSGNASGMGGSTTFPAALTAPAPMTPGTYTWQMAYYGNQDGTGAGDVHSEVRVATNSFTVTAPPPAVDSIVPVVGTFTLPTTAASLTVPVTALAATDNVAVTGYLITTTATAPAASAAGWSAAAPASVTAPAAGSVTFYAWAKDAAGNVSLARSATVVISLPDSIVPVVGTFTLPTTAASLTVPVTALAATDNVAVTGYLITTTDTAPAAATAGWSAAAPASVTAPAAGSVTFYAWAKDAAGNVSLARSATVVISLSDSIVPVVGTFTLPTTAASLTVPVTALAATDNVAVTGYLITTTATAPAAATAGWSAAAPASVTAPAAGSVTFYAWAKDAAGNVSLARSATVVISLPVNVGNPVLTLSTLDDGAVTNRPTLNISGSAIDPDGIKSVTLNNKPLRLRVDNTFTATLKLLQGANTINVTATDNGGNQSSDTRTITYDRKAPALTVNTPADHTRTAESFITVSGTVNEASTVTVSDNGGDEVFAAIDGNSFSATVYLVAGMNNLIIKATDPARNTTKVKRTVDYDNVKPNLEVTYPRRDMTTRKNQLVLTGKAKGLVGAASVTITMGSATFTPPLVNGNFRQAVTFPQDGVYEIDFTVTDDSGSSSVQRTIICQPMTHQDDDDDD